MAKSVSLKSQMITGYLILYNLFAAYGWILILGVCVKHIIAGSYEQLWLDVEAKLKIYQTLACLEILHSMIGFVKSPWLTTSMQGSYRTILNCYSNYLRSRSEPALLNGFILSCLRVWTLWAVMDVAPPAQQSIFIALACTSWALVEVPRYLFYALNLIDCVPYPLLWLRYSLFAILYPTGITGELGCMYMAFRYYLKSNSNPPLLVAIVLVALTYIPGSPQMYGHMLKTRKKSLLATKEGKTGKKAE